MGRTATPALNSRDKNGRCWTCPISSDTIFTLIAHPGDKPRLIRVSIKPAGEVPFTIGDTRRKAMDYVLHVDLGGVKGVIAPVIGKQPPDYHIWILVGSSPASFVKKVRCYEGGPIWRIEQISPALAPG
jgi:hypothetical protein